MREECSKHGALKRVIIPRPTASVPNPPGVAKVIIEYDDMASALRARNAMHGRKFGGRTVHRCPCCTTAKIGLTKRASRPLHCCLSDILHWAASAHDTARMSADSAAATRLGVLSRHFTSATVDSVFAGLPDAPPDPILAVGDAWRADPHPAKLNLGVGAYRTEGPEQVLLAVLLQEGKPLVLSVVRKAEVALAADPAANKEYAAITGDPVFCRLARELAFSTASPALTQGRTVTVQALSGTGSLRVGAELLATHYAVKTVLIPRPTWPTHRAIFARAGMQVLEYRYFMPATRGLDIEGLLADLAAAPQGAVVILHACAHNPTGVDPSPAQWRRILEVVQSRQLLPFFDSAYQGFASGDLDADAASIRLFAAAVNPTTGKPQ
ncbi:hypothetical protein QJQ45_030313, partial [Haematococcus lacustris]